MISNIIFNFRNFINQVFLSNTNNLHKSVYSIITYDNNPYKKIEQFYLAHWLNPNRYSNVESEWTREQW